MSQDEPKSDGKGYQLRGEVAHVGEIEEVGSKGFRKQLLVVRTADEKYPQEVPIYFTQSNIAKISDKDVEAGNEVTVTFDLRGREWNGKYYPELNGWKIVNHSAQRPPATDQEPTPAPAPASKGEARPSQLKDEEDLPF